MAWPAVALALGALPDTDPQVAAILEAPGALRQTIARAAATALQRSAERQPLALVVDDVHWADQTSLDLLELAAMDARCPLWVCVAARPQLLSLPPDVGKSIEPGSDDDSRTAG